MLARSTCACLLRRLRPALPFDVHHLDTRHHTRLVSTASRHLYKHRHPTIAAPCLAAVAPRSTSRASATAPARATSPTNSNGTSLSLARPRRPPPFLHRLSPIAALYSYSLRHCSCGPRRASSPSPRTPSRARARPTPSLAPSTRRSKPSLTSSSYGRLVRCDIPAPRSASSRL
jgi:hypothetical protein